MGFFFFGLFIFGFRFFCCCEISWLRWIVWFVGDVLWCYLGEEVLVFFGGLDGERYIVLVSVFFF